MKKKIEERNNYVIIVGAGYAIKYNGITKAEAIIAFEDACKTYADMEVSIYQSTNLYAK